MTQKLDLKTGKLYNEPDYARIATKIRESIWLTTPETLDVILSIANKRLNGEQFSNEYLEEIMLRNNNHDDGESEIQVVNGVGILPIMGPIFGKANLMTQLSGATSLEVSQSHLREMVKDESIHSILLNIDSGGGTSDLVQEMGDEIYNARQSKPVYAIANTDAGSAAYWLASQANKTFVTPSGSVGSIGAFTVHEDQSVADAQSGVKYSFISAGQYKTEGNPHEALTDEGRQFRQERIDELYGNFVGAVARGRGVSTDTVKESFGGGRMLSSTKAKQAGLVDDVVSYDSLLGSLSRTSSSMRGGENVNHEQLLQFAQSLNVTVADGETDEQITTKCNSAIAAMNAELVPLRELRQQTDNQRSFAQQYPEEFARMQKLEKDNLEASAKMFAANYETCWDKKVSTDGSEIRTPNQKGFSSLLRDEISAMHLALANRPDEAQMFTGILDLFASGQGIVDFSESGSSRQGLTEPTNQMTGINGNARNEFRAFTQEVAAREENKGKLFPEILIIAANEKPDLAEAWQASSVTARNGN